MKIRPKFLQLLFFGIIIGNVVSCDSSKSQKSRYETLVFNVDETLLEPAIMDADLNISIAAPKNWTAIDDSVLAQVITQSSDMLMQGLQMEPRWIFLNHPSQAMCVVSRLNALDITQGETVLKELEVAYSTQFPNAVIQSTIFLKEEFRVHQLMVNSSQFVLIKLLCDAPEILPFEVDYFIPKKVYEQELRAIESSIGSIHSVTSQP
ncbi:hypothetical protein IH992_22165 [Candidatus Poribacteria bacterium]|nr:hypothetical protein [Candidatus Poribacteria bacterium]